MCPPKFHKLLYKLLTTLCVVSDCAPPIKKSFLRLCSAMQKHGVHDATFFHTLLAVYCAQISPSCNLKDEHLLKQIN